MANSGTPSTPGVMKTPIATKLQLNNLPTLKRIPSRDPATINSPSNPNSIGTPTAPRKQFPQVRTNERFGTFRYHSHRCIANQIPASPIAIRSQEANRRSQTAINNHDAAQARIVGTKVFESCQGRRLLIHSSSRLAPRVSTRLVLVGGIWCVPRRRKRSSSTDRDGSPGATSSGLLRPIVS